MIVQSLGWEDPLEEEIAPHSSILAWEIPWTEEPGGLQSMGSRRVGHNSTDMNECDVKIQPGFLSRKKRMQGTSLIVILIPC